MTGPARVLLEAVRDSRDRNQEYTPGMSKKAFRDEPVPVLSRIIAIGQMRPVPYRFETGCGWPACLSWRPSLPDRVEGVEPDRQSPPNRVREPTFRRKDQSEVLPTPERVFECPLTVPLSEDLRF